MTDLFQEPEDATPLEAEEREQLLQSWITNRADLNIAEEENIVDGAAWARGRRSRRPADMSSVDFAIMLHKRMFGDVWWAGTYRTTARTHRSAEITPRDARSYAPMNALDHERAGMRAVQ